MLLSIADREVKRGKAKLSEVDAFLEIVKEIDKEAIKDKKYSEIAEYLTEKFGLLVTESQVSLLHEPDIESEASSLEIWYRSMGF